MRVVECTLSARSPVPVVDSPCRRRRLDPDDAASLVVAASGDQALVFEVLHLRSHRGLVDALPRRQVGDSEWPAVGDPGEQPGVRP